MLQLTFSLIITFIHAMLDANKIKKREYINHSTRAAIWGAVCSAMSFALMLVFGYDLKYLIEAVMSSIVIRTAFYDVILNTIRGKYFLYISEFTGSKIDLLYQRLGINQNFIRGFATIVSFFLLAYCVKNRIF